MENKYRIECGMYTLLAVKCGLEADVVFPEQVIIPIRHNGREVSVAGRIQAIDITSAVVSIELIIPKWVFDESGQASV